MRRARLAQVSELGAIDMTQTHAFQPMLASRLEPGANLKATLDHYSKSGAYVAEAKLDGHRAIAYIQNGKVVNLLSRQGNDTRVRFPDVVAVIENTIAKTVPNCVLDGELGPIDPTGLKMDIAILQTRPRTDTFGIKMHAKQYPMSYVVFDVLDVDGADFTILPYTQRRAWLESHVSDSDFIRVSPASSDMHGLYDVVVSSGGEGIIVKTKHGLYNAGKRSPEWLKVKAPDYHDNLHVVGLLKGDGKRAWAFGALVLARETPNGLEYVCKAGTGLSDHDLSQVLQLVPKLKRDDAPIKKLPYFDQPIVTWLNKGLMCDVKYQQPTAKSPRFPAVVSLSYEGKHL